MSVQKVFNNNVLLKNIEESNINQATNLDLSSETDKNEKFKKAEIIDFGENIPLDKSGKSPIIKVGEIILYDRNKASNLTLEGIAYKIVQYGDLICKP